jgi:uncharacterized protein YjbI with pentapeptide repeats
MDKAKLKDILDKHLKWLRHEDGGGRANLCGANLSGADLWGANLSVADLSGATLSGANLCGANLSVAGLWGANLSGADLRGANLSGAILTRADLSGANLWGANLSEAGLSRAKIEINLLNTVWPIVCPETGSFIAWKKCANNTVVKLEVLANAKRSSACSRKCRCSAARVLAIENIDGTPYKENSVSSQRDSAFIYTVGEIVKVDDFDEDRRNECCTGIHFFITRQEAVDW